MQPPGSRAHTDNWNRSKVKVTRSRYINDIFSVLFALTLTRSSADAKRPCDCSAGQFWPKYDCEMIFCCEPYRSIFNHCDVIGLLIYERISTGNSVFEGVGQFRPNFHVSCGTPTERQHYVFALRPSVCIFCPVL